MITPAPADLWERVIHELALMIYNTEKLNKPQPSPLLHIRPGSQPTPTTPGGPTEAA